jgi:dipeptide/tripeptide permease
MSGLLSFLLKSGGGLLRESAEAYIGGVLVRKTIHELVRAAIVYVLIGVFSIVALVFLYIFLYQWLADRLDGKSAAAILCGANLVMIAVILLVQWLRKNRMKLEPKASAGGLLGNLQGHPLLDPDNLDAGIAMGMEVGKKLRKAAPQIALAAGIIGLIVGVRPELLNLLGGRGGKPKDKQ